MKRKKKSKPRPVAWLHTMHYEKGGGSNAVVGLTKENPFGKPGVDYSAGYPVTSEPLYRGTAT
jgi:hypothetical protein